MYENGQRGTHYLVLAGQTLASQSGMLLVMRMGVIRVYRMIQALQEEVS